MRGMRGGGESGERSKRSEGGKVRNVRERVKTRRREEGEDSAKR